jgi:hypothetical protein
MLLANTQCEQMLHILLLLVTHRTERYKEDLTNKNPGQLKS